MARRVILQGWFGMNNFGDDLLLEITLKHLLKHVENVRIDVIGEGRDRPAFLPADVKYLPRASRIWAWLRRRWLRSGADWVLCGGSVLQESILQRFIEPASEVKRAGGRVFLHAIGLRDMMMLTPQVKSLMAHVDGCSLRERYAWELLSDSWPVELVADPVFSINLPATTETNGTLLVALRGGEELESHMENFVCWLTSVANAYTSIDLMVCFPAQDGLVSRRIAHLLVGFNVNILEDSSAHKLATRVAAADQVVTMRLHPAIVALAAGKVPWVLAPEHKQRALMSDIGREDHLLSWDQLDQMLGGLPDSGVDMDAFKIEGHRSLELLTDWISDG